MLICQTGAKAGSAQENGRELSEIEKYLNMKSWLQPFHNQLLGDANSYRDEAFLPPRAGERLPKNNVGPTSILKNPSGTV